METLSTPLALYEWDPRRALDFRPKRPVMRTFDISFDVGVNKQLDK